jgi:hypothetical protein
MGEEHRLGDVFQYQVGSLATPRHPVLAMGRVST